MENKIVYFGGKHTFLLEKEANTEQLERVRKDGGFDFAKDLNNSASCVFKKEIYAFKWYNHKEVHRYSLESGKWILFYASE